jgi:hypothetical protein
LTNKAIGGSGVILANSCEVSGFNIFDIRGGSGILGGDNNPVAPTTPGIKNTLITKNVIMRSSMLNGSIYLANCEGKLVIRDNLIFNIASPVNFKTGIEILNANIPVTSRVIIKKNVTSNMDFTGIELIHNSPSGRVRTAIEENIVFNIGNDRDGIFVGTRGTTANGRICAKIEKNFIQNIPIEAINLQSSGTAHVNAKVKENVGLNGTLRNISASAFDASHFCLKLIKNFSDNGYAVAQNDISQFKLEPLEGNLGTPFQRFGIIQNVASGKCKCE